MDFDEWLLEMNKLLEQGSKNDFIIHNGREWNRNDKEGDYEVGTSIKKSKMFDNACYIVYSKID